MVIFENTLRKNLIIIVGGVYYVTKYIHQNASFSKFPRRRIPLDPSAMHSMRLRDMHTLLKKYLHPSIKPCNVCAFVAF